MTEVDIIRDMEYCSIGKCHKCSRSKDDDLGCRDKLMQDAISIMKLQQNAVTCGAQAIDQLKMDNASLSMTARFNFTKLELVKKVNRIIRCFSNDGNYDSGDGQDEWGGKIDALKDFIELIGIANCSIVVNVKEDYPTIQYLELKK